MGLAGIRSVSFQTSLHFFVFEITFYLEVNCSEEHLLSIHYLILLSLSQVPPEVGGGITYLFGS